VMRDVAGELGYLRSCRQIPIEQEPAYIEVIAAFDELIDWIAAIEQDAIVAVDIGDRRAAGAGLAKRRVVGPAAGLLAQAPGIDHRRAEGRFEERQFGALVAVAEINRAGSRRHRTPPDLKARELDAAPHNMSI